MMREAISSIHIEKGSNLSFFHNDRSNPTKNSIFSDEENEVSCGGKEALLLYQNELRTRIKKYINRIGQKLNALTITHLTAILNLNAHHKLKDVNEVADHLESQYGTKILQIAIHKDEGHVDEYGNARKNYHAHIEFLGLDYNGKSIKRTLGKKELSDLQTKVAEILQMKRGINYIREKKNRPRRLDTYDYKEAMNKKEEAIKPIMKNFFKLENDFKKTNMEKEKYQLILDKYPEIENLVNAIKKHIQKYNLSAENLTDGVNSIIKYYITEHTKALELKMQKERENSKYYMIENQKLQIENKELKKQNIKSNYEYMKLVTITENFISIEKINDLGELSIRELNMMNVRQYSSESMQNEKIERERAKLKTELEKSHREIRYLKLIVEIDQLHDEQQQNQTIQ